MKLKIFFIVLISVLASSNPVFAEVERERILEFSSDINITKDSDIEVREDIKIVANDDQIKRGIFRYLPLGNQEYRFDYKVLSVKKNGVAEPYELSTENGFLIIRIGQENVFLNPGIYDYEITYKAIDQLFFFKNYDEIYWNVTGNGWNFEIEKAIATIHLPGAAKIINKDAYTGLLGDKGSDYDVNFDQNNNLVFTTNKALGPNQGLTVAATFPKGVVNQKSNFVKILLQYGLAVLALLAALIYYLIIWNKFGRDPKKGTIIPLFEPPVGISPAGVGHIFSQGSPDAPRLFSVALVNMAVKGYLKIKVEAAGLFGKKKISLEKIDGKFDDLSNEEGKVWEVIASPNSETSIFNELIFRQKGQDLVPAFRECEKSLILEYGENYFAENSGYFLAGLIISAGVVGFKAEAVVFIFLGTMIAFFGKISKNKLLVKVILAAFLTAAAFLILQNLDYLQKIFAISAIVMNALFSFLLKAPTKKGREVLDKILGFKMYLEVAEKNLLEMSTSYAGKDVTPEVFEKYLPYAMALKVENKWAQKFSDSVSKATSINQNNMSYIPLWYVGSAVTNFNIANIDSQITSQISSALANEIKAAGGSGASGASSGGGSSGGGSGGGGGGGW